MFDVKAGMIQGRSHRREGKNCQDSFSILKGTIHSKDFIAGVISDGCGSGLHTEVGAKLSTQFLTRTLRGLVGLIPFSQIPEILWTKQLSYLNAMLHLQDLIDPREKATFINDYLLFTTIGFLIYGDQGMVFANGDGLVVINEDIHIRNSDNKPPYIGYHLVDRNMLVNPGTPLPTRYDLYTFNVDQLMRLGVGSDAWEDEADLISEVWNLGDNARTLNRKMRVWSSDQNQHFQDDAVLITVERGEQSVSKVEADPIT